MDSQRLVQKDERGLTARNVAMWMIWESGTKSLREIGELFVGLDYAAVAQRIHRIRLPAEALDDALRKLTRPEGADLIQRNHALHRMLVDGVTVGVPRH